MSASLSASLEAWEGEGGAIPGPPSLLPVQLRGTEAQVEWAERIRRQVDAEFDRVASAFRAVSRRQGAAKRARTEAIIAILEERRAEVMLHGQAGYFIHDWQEISDQVRRMIHDDPRFAVRTSANSDITTAFHRNGPSAMETWSPITRRPSTTTMSTASAARTPPSRRQALPICILPSATSHAFSS